MTQWPDALMTCSVAALQHRVTARLLRSIHSQGGVTPPSTPPPACPTVSWSPSCSITSPLTPTCGSPALWQEGVPCGGGKRSGEAICNVFFFKKKP